jgi:hypothetical protein
VWTGVAASHPPFYVSGTTRSGSAPQVHRRIPDNVFVVSVSHNLDDG